MFRRFTRFVFGSGLILALSACTNTFVYNNLDWLSYWYIDDYVVLTDVQEAQFDPMLNEFLVWHRQSQLPLYRDLLLQVKQDVGQGLTQQMIQDRTEQGRELWLNLLKQSAPDLIAMAKTMSDQQVDDFLATLEQNNRDREQDVAELSDQDRIEQRIENIEDSISSVFGRLNQQQKLIIADLAPKLQSNFDDWMQYRRSWASELQAAYAVKDNDLLFTQKMQVLITDPQSLRSEAYHQRVSYNRELWSEALVDLAEKLTEKQKRRFNNKIDGYIEDIEDLIADE